MPQPSSSCTDVDLGVTHDMSGASTVILHQLNCSCKSTLAKADEPPQPHPTNHIIAWSSSENLTHLLWGFFLLLHSEKGTNHLTQWKCYHFHYCFYLWWNTPEAKPSTRIKPFKNLKRKKNVHTWLLKPWGVSILHPFTLRAALISTYCSTGCVGLGLRLSSLPWPPKSILLASKAQREWIFPYFYGSCFL